MNNSQPSRNEELAKKQNGRKSSKQTILAFTKIPIMDGDLLQNMPHSAEHSTSMKQVREVDEFGFRFLA